MNRKVIVYYKKESKFNNQTGEYDIYQRPPFETVESNLESHQKIHGNIIKEIKLAEDEKIVIKKPELPTQNTNVNDVEKNILTDKIDVLTKEVDRLREANVNITEMLHEQKENKEIEIKDIVKYFIDKDKTPLSIAKYLNIDIKEVNKLLPETVA